MNLNNRLEIYIFQDLAIQTMLVDFLTFFDLSKIMVLNMYLIVYMKTLLFKLDLKLKVFLTLSSLYLVSKKQIFAFFTFSAIKEN